MLLLLLMLLVLILLLRLLGHRGRIAGKLAVAEGRTAKLQPVRIASAQTEAAMPCCRSGALCTLRRAGGLHGLHRRFDPGRDDRDADHAFEIFAQRRADLDLRFGIHFLADAVRGLIDFDIKEVSLDAMPALGFKIMMNVGNPDRAFDFSRLPNAGVGLARLEFIINRMIGVHPKALLNFAGLPAEIKDSVEKRIAGYDDPVGFYVEKLVEGISTLAAAFWPKKVIVRLSDFKSNEYANLIGGKLYEPEEENPMLGFRGASR